ncbi:MAG: bifunctional 5,10-methylene-tetrahydrofolate dehydrogenase/5,10-methylene-tetrahydrofolate cyclohydrolase [Actinobacteria bacterium]|nr:bifunctional 5,10-methylene-tetrahydrofolate dehydrogenase/5,10-methylene-tetrahydrofolate cyclohydrolase [Actinomycetota bacterium]MBU4301958.1 bifunctional 5,10-methylene-tetrahydrofolate dehydrogenase/5,10-methylene-tetrahydrofolate cyclohydrolase [Actinomycetota bacterium]
MAEIIDGNAIADEIKAEIVAEIEKLKEKGITAGIATLLVGDDFGSRMYRKQVERNCESVEFNYIEKTLPAETTEEEVVKVVQELNDDPAVSGILPLRPFPEHISDSAVINTIKVDKDIDCFHPFNMGRLTLGEPTLTPCTPSACIELLERVGVEFEGAEIVVVGHSNIVGKPVALLALNRNANVTVSHIFTSQAGNLAKHTTGADILIVAAGKAGLITADLVKDGAVVIDVGINRVKVLDDDGNPVLNEKGKPKTRTVGDVDFDNVKDKAKAITPVPGGVGAVTNMILLKNALRAAKTQAGLE